MSKFRICKNSSTEIPTWKIMKEKFDEGKKNSSNFSKVVIWRLFVCLHFHTVWNLHFCPKIQLWFPEKIVDFFGWKTRENVVVLDFLAVDNFDFTRKIVKKIWGEKLVKMLGFGQNWIFGQKFDFSNSVKQCTFVFAGVDNRIPCQPKGHQVGHPAAKLYYNKKSKNRILPGVGP